MRVSSTTLFGFVPLLVTILLESGSCTPTSDHQTQFSTYSHPRPPRFQRRQQRIRPAAPIFQRREDTAAAFFPSDEDHGHDQPQQAQTQRQTRESTSSLLPTAPVKFPGSATPAQPQISPKSDETPMFGKNFEKAIDAIVSASRSGRQLDLTPEEDAELTKVLSDPVIKQQLEAGNEAQARGLIRDKLCDLGLMTCAPKKFKHPQFKPGHPQHHISNKFGHYGGPPSPPQFNPHASSSSPYGHYGQGYGQGIGSISGHTLSGPPISAQDVSYVQPVALKTVGAPIPAIPLEQPTKFSGSSQITSYPPPPGPTYGAGGFAKQSLYDDSYFGPGKIQSPPSYGPPPGSYPSPPKTVQYSSYSQPIIQQKQQPQPSNAVPSTKIEHVHHHIHHQANGGGSSIAKENYGEYGTIGQIGLGEYGAAQKVIPTIVAPPTLNKKSSHFDAQAQSLSPNYLGPPNHARNCICVPVDQCSTYSSPGTGNGLNTIDPYQQHLSGPSEMEYLETQGREVIQGTGIPNNGFVGYGIDPRNKGGRNLEIESNDTATSNETTTDNEFGGDDEIQTTTVLPEFEIDGGNKTKAAEEDDEKDDEEASKVSPALLRRRREADDEEDEDETKTTTEKPQAAQGDGQAQPRRLDNNSCRIRSIGYVCCDPSKVKNQRQLGIGGALSSNYDPPSQPIYTPSQTPFGSAFADGRDLNAAAAYSNSNNAANVGQCGLRNSNGINGRVITAGAQTLTDGETDFGEYPWQVAILNREGTFVCGGSLISPNYIATAAHCLKSVTNPSELRVRLGEWDVNSQSEFYPHFERKVVKTTVHPEFYAGNLLNDIALLRFDGFVDFRQAPHVSPVCVPTSDMDFGGKRCFVTGWGKDAFGKGGKYQNVLKEVDLPVLSNFDCEQKLKRTRLGPDFTLSNGFMCAGGEPGKDACKGDGGGPLVCQTQNGAWQLAGIVSWGVGCGEANVPGVYVKVSHYQNWIQHVVSTGL